MNQKKDRLRRREQQLIELLLQGCENAEIASELKMGLRTVKANFNTLFRRFKIFSGIKRVKLATLLYRRQACLQLNSTEPVSPVIVNADSSNSSPKA
jgi:DNA-binding NarL/FixJ family response regulator